MKLSCKFRFFVYNSNCNYAKAIEGYEKAIELKPDYASAYHNLGIVYRKQGNFDKSIESYEKAIELDPDDASVYYNLGIAYHNDDDFTTALFYYRKAASLGHQGSRDWLKDSGYDW